MAESDAPLSPLASWLDTIRSYLLPREEGQTSVTPRLRSRSKPHRVAFDDPKDGDGAETASALGSVLNFSALKKGLGGKDGSLVSKNLKGGSFRLTLGALLLALLALVAFSVSLALLIHWNNYDDLETNFFHYFDDETRGDHLALAKGHGFWMFLAFTILLPTQILLEATCQYLNLTQGFTSFLDGVMRLIRVFCLVMGFIPLFTKEAGRVPDFSDHSVHLILSIFCLTIFLVESGICFIRLSNFKCLQGIKLFDCLNPQFVVTFLDSTNKFYTILAVFSGFQRYTLSFAVALHYEIPEDGSKSPNEFSFDAMLTMLFLGFLGLYWVQVIKHYNSDHMEIITQTQYRKKFAKIADKLQARLDEEEANELEAVETDNN